MNDYFDICNAGMHVYLSPRRASSRVLVFIFLSCGLTSLRVNLPGLTRPNLAGLIQSN